MGLLYGRAGRLTAENGGFRPGQSRADRTLADLGGEDGGGGRHVDAGEDDADDLLGVGTVVHQLEVCATGQRLV